MVKTSNQQGYRGVGSIDNFTAVLKNFDSSRAIDITSLIIDVAIYEDIFSETVFGSASIRDGINLLNGISNVSEEQKVFPIVGEEFIEFSYNVTGSDRVDRRFFVYSVKNVDIEDSFNVRTYSLDFVSEEHLIDSTFLIQRGYKDHLSSMAEDILKKDLSVDQEIPFAKRKKNITIQKTRGKQDIVIPNLSPIESLNFLARRSISEEKYNSGTYLFFENKRGFNFCDIEFLISEGKKRLNGNVKRYKYTYSNSNINDDVSLSDPNSNGFKNFFSLKQKHKFDTIEKLLGGYFASEMIVYDVLNRRVRTKNFGFLETYKDSNVLGSETGGSYPENTLDFIKTVNPDSEKFMGIFSLKKTKQKHTRQFLIPYDSSKPDTFLDEIYTNRASYLTRLKQNMFTAECAGDSEITAGDVILLNFPQITGSTGATNKESDDSYLSGYFLITAIQEKITPDSYVATYDLLKNGYAQPVVSTDNKETPESAQAK